MGPAGPQGHDAFAGQVGYPLAGGLPGPGEQHAPYPEYQMWSPHGPQGGYPGPVSHQDAINGGDYAYVIREDDPYAPPASRPRGRERGQGLGEWEPTSAGPASDRARTPAGDVGGVRAITAGAAARAAAQAAAQAAANVGPARAYGHDDQAYGAPEPDRHQRDEETPRRAVDSGPDDDDQDAPRGPFEALRPTGGYPALEPDEATAALADDGADDEEVPDLLDFGPPSDPEAGALGQITDLYLTAETITPASLDRNFDQLMEKQRQLITDYFEESGGLILVEPPATEEPEPAAAGEPEGQSAPLGFDSATSLAGLLGDLRGGQ
jgi:hypothetical protein